MTNKRLSITVLLLMIISLSFIPISSAMIFPWPDWSTISPVVVDTVGDESANYDILKCYISSDDDNFYFKIEVLGTIMKSSIYVLLDTDQNSNTGDNGTSIESLDPGGELSQHGIGADYFLDPMDTADLVKWVGYWEWVKPVPWLQDADSLEIAVAREDIGNPDSINVLFLSNPPDTDYAPNRGYVTYPLWTVGGSIITQTHLPAIPLYLSMFALVIAGTVLIIMWRRPGIRARAE